MWYLKLGRVVLAWLYASLAAYGLFKAISLQYWWHWVLCFITVLIIEAFIDFFSEIIDGTEMDMRRWS